MRSRFCKMCGKWHDLEAWPIECVPERSVAASDLPTPRIISDAIEIQSMLDGKHYTSKSQLRGTYRAAGVEEVGNEPMKKQERPSGDRQGIRNELRRVVAKKRA